jgi:Permuted papain-like amidase enzyme, YaeF/YiiX, C92 family
MLQSAGDKPNFPMTVKAFFDDADHYLNRGDILLSRSPFVASRLIRLFSKSFFSHAAVVFLLPQRSEHFTNTFVIESLFKGVGIANLETYVSGRNPVEEVGILRMDGEGFSQDFFKRANGILLNEVNKPYAHCTCQRVWVEPCDPKIATPTKCLSALDAASIYLFRLYPIWIFQGC